MMMSSMADVEFRCPNVNCHPLATISTSKLFYCQIACLAQERCRTVNFRQSNNTCELFAEMPDDNSTMPANIGTILMAIIDGTRIPFGYYIQSRIDGYVLEIYNGSTQAGASIVVSPMKNRTSKDPSSQLWFFDQDGTIRNVASGMVIDIYGGIQGTDLVISPKTGEASQQWKSDGEYLVCPGAVKVIDLARSNTAVNAPVIAWPKNFGLNQQWNLLPHRR
ncbi:unnamed protein product [Rotaria sp. Silwood2]|nr:unnamed protein product [Rotaria sp. Silwood2]CAF4395169.1 unnamed protein product [Rotaria sp. Silwood2]